MRAERSLVEKIRIKGSVTISLAGRTFSTLEFINKLLN